MTDFSGTSYEPLYRRLCMHMPLIGAALSGAAIGAWAATRAGLSRRWDFLVLVLAITVSAWLFVFAVVTYVWIVAFW
jgi:hypothetical protein